MRRALATDVHAVLRLSADGAVSPLGSIVLVHGDAAPCRKRERSAAKPNGGWLRAMIDVAVAADWDRLLELRETWRSAGKTVVWTNGVFDLLHVGHLRSLEAARRFGDILVVGVNGDESVRALKGAGRPIVPADERAELLSGLRAVDEVIIFDEATPEHALARLKPDIHSKGADYAPPDGKPIPELNLVHSYGGRVEFLPLVLGISSTELARRAQEAAAEGRGQ